MCSIIDRDRGLSIHGVAANRAAFPGVRSSRFPEEVPVYVLLLMPVLQYLLLPLLS